MLDRKQSAFLTVLWTFDLFSLGSQISYAREGNLKKEVVSSWISQKAFYKPFLLFFQHCTHFVMDLGQLFGASLEFFNTGEAYLDTAYLQASQGGSATPDMFKAIHWQKALLPHSFDLFS